MHCVCANLSGWVYFGPSGDVGTRRPFLCPAASRPAGCHGRDAPFRGETPGGGVSRKSHPSRFRNLLGTHSPVFRPSASICTSSPERSRWCHAGPRGRDRYRVGPSASIRRRKGFPHTHTGPPSRQRSVETPQTRYDALSDTSTSGRLPQADTGSCLVEPFPQDTDRPYRPGKETAMAPKGGGAPT